MIGAKYNVTKNIKKHLGAATYTFLYKESIFSAIDSLARSGFRTIELTATPPHIDIDDFDNQSRKRLRTRVAKCEINIVSVNPTYLDLNLASLNTGMRKETVRQLKLTLQLCSDLEATILVLFGGRRHVLIPAPLNITKQVVVDELEYLLDYANMLGVTIGLENGPTLLFQTGTDLVDMIKLMSSPNLRAVFDVANAHMVEEPINGLKAILPYMNLLHISDTTKAKWAHSPVGDGDVQFDKIAEVLDAATYLGPSILEVIDIDNPNAGLERSAFELNQLGWSTS